MDFFYMVPKALLSQVCGGIDEGMIAIILNKDRSAEAMVFRVIRKANFTVAT
jgi:hypothetical protein